MGNAPFGPGPTALKSLALDLAPAMILAGVLALVYAVDASSVERIAVPGDSTPLVIVSKPSPPPVLNPRMLRLGVSPPHPDYDDMGKLLATLGEGYKYTTFDLVELADPDKLSQYDVIFICCSNSPHQWLGERVGNAARPNVTTYTQNDAEMQRVGKAVRQFVNRGGTVYASDWHVSVIAAAFPELVDREKKEPGAAQEVTATIVDEGLRELLGPTLKLRFDLNGWEPAAFRGETVKDYMRGTFRVFSTPATGFFSGVVSESGRKLTAPLLVKFGHGEGTVIFSSFHNEKQNSEEETTLLKYLVFSAVTAEVDTRVAQTMLKGGFSAAKRNLFSTSPGDASVTGSYHFEKAGHLQFVLGFQDQAARLKLRVVAPDGTPYEKEDTSTITVDIPAALAGDWKYTVTAVQVPSQNFPFTIAIGAK